MARSQNLLSGEVGQRVAFLGFMACFGKEDSSFYDPPQGRSSLSSMAFLGGERA